jgi:dephospho-CoA kinase
MTGQKWDKKIIGLSGGIGSGKSTVARLFEMFGCEVFNSDEAAKQCYYFNDIKEKVIALLGKEAYLSDGKLNRTFISEKIFSDENLRSQINRIIHPRVGELFQDFVRQSDKKIIVKESALLFETGIYKKCSKNILVVSPYHIKSERLRKRDNMSDEEIHKRISMQWPDEKKIPLADFIIHNDEKSSLIFQTENIYNQLAKSD